jgi:hypothetical protein
MNHAFEIIPLTIEARGEIITNNLPEFRELVREALGNINRDLVTDEEFEQAEKDVKALKAAEDAVRDAAVKAFDDKLKELVDGLNETAEDIRAPRLELEKIIAKRKDEVKVDLIRQGLEKIDCAARLRKANYERSLTEAIKGKRTVESMSKALQVVITVHNGTIAKNRAAIESFSNAHGAELVPDAEDLEIKSPDSVEGELRRRFDAKKAAAEAAKLKAEADKAKAEAAKANAALAEANKPPVPPANPPPPPPDNVEQGPWQPSGVESIAPQEETADQEWAAFKAQCLAAFKPLKEAREGLKHSANIAKAQGFANAINQAWKEWA